MQTGVRHDTRYDVPTPYRAEAPTCMLHSIIEDDDCPVCDIDAYYAVGLRAEGPVHLATLDIVLG